MKKMVWLAVLPLLLSAAESPGRTPEPNRTPEALPLYPKGAPESNGLSADSVKVLPDVIFGAVDADYLVLPADPTQATGQAVVICPGGGYGAICFDHEGLQVARWFNTQGVTAIVLRYRMPNGHPEIPLSIRTGSASSDSRPEDTLPQPPRRCSPERTTVPISRSCATRPPRTIRTSSTRRPSAT